ncbi:MAG: glutathione S-transferase family protein [Rhodospirillaceae bacterium]|nr:glutathione S-transferase family protein [Rhodospirillaceae bacterium]
MIDPTRPQLFGAHYSVYVRIARLALLEKGIAHDTHEVDIFAAGGPPADYMRLNPFARIPTLVHGDFALYETTAITRYVDEAFAGARLQPTDAMARARMNQIISIADNYLYRPLVWGIYVARDEAAKNNVALDQAPFDAAVATSRLALAALAGLCDGGEWLSGPALSLADLHVAPMIAYGCLTAEGLALLREQPRLVRWWERMNARPSMAATRYQAEGKAP